MLSIKQNKIYVNRGKSSKLINNESIANHRQEERMPKRYRYLF